MFHSDQYESLITSPLLPSPQKIMDTCSLYALKNYVNFQFHPLSSISKKNHGNTLSINVLDIVNSSYLIISIFNLDSRPPPLSKKSWKYISSLYASKNVNFSILFFPIHFPKRSWKSMSIDVLGVILFHFVSFQKNSRGAKEWTRKVLHILIFGE